MAQSPAELVGLVLRESKRRGVEFDQAWMYAVRCLPRSQPDIMEWRRALADSKESWRDAYDGVVRTRVASPTVSESDLVRLANRVCEGRASEQTAVL